MHAPLTFRQERFVFEYLKDQNASAAAGRAGYTAANLASQGNELLKNPAVRDRVRVEMESLLAEIRCSELELMRQRARTAFFDPGQLLDGWEPVPLDELDGEARAALEVSTVLRRSGPVVRVKQGCRHRALRALERVQERMLKLREAALDRAERLGALPTQEEMDEWEREEDALQEAQRAQAQIGAERVEAERSELGRAGAERVEAKRGETGQVGIERAGVELTGVELTGVELIGAEPIGAEQADVELAGLELAGLRQAGAEQARAGRTEAGRIAAAPDAVVPAEVLRRDAEAWAARWLGEKHQVWSGKAPGGEGRAARFSEKTQVLSGGAVPMAAGGVELPRRHQVLPGGAVPGEAAGAVFSRQPRVLSGCTLAPPPGPGRPAGADGEAARAPACAVA